MNRGDTEQATIETHLRANADRYCARTLKDAQVVLLRRRSRASSRLYWYRIGDRSSYCVVVVKVPGEPADTPVVQGGGERPRLLEPPPLETKYAREHQALDLLQRHVSRLDDPRFGAVPLLGRIDAVRAIVMREVEGRSLTALSPLLGRIHPGPPGPLLRRSVRNAGAWLRAYHRLELEDAIPRHTRREDFVHNVQRCCDHLGATLSRHGFFDDLANRLIAAAHRLFPEELPLGLGHGDFAMRNVLVGREGRVFVLDTSAVWRTPVYADLAKFPLAVRLSRVQVYSHGAAFSPKSIDTVERWLFEGYYGNEPAPDQQIRLYGLLLLLDKWSFERALPPPRSRWAGELKVRMLDSWYTSQAREMATRLAEEATAGSPARRPRPL